MINKETLHAIDNLYLENFHQTLLHKVVHAYSEFRGSIRQAASITEAVEISPDCRIQYAEIIERLQPIVITLGQMADDMQTGNLPSPECAVPVQWSLVDTIPQAETNTVLDKIHSVEHEAIKTINLIGKSLTSLTGNTTSWSSTAVLRSFFKLKPIQERPCYSLWTVTDFCGSPPFQLASWKSHPQKNTAVDGDQQPFLLDSEFMSLTILPVFKNIEVNIEINGVISGK